MGILDISALGIILICLILAFATYHKRLLNLSGAVTAFFMALFIGFQGGLVLLFLLLIFLISSFLATKYKFRYKKERGIQEGLEGERGWINVLANGAVPVVILLLSRSGSILGLGFLESHVVLALFVASIAAAASDTLASEMGMTSEKAYLITDLKRVKPGTDGGVSLYGELWAFIGSFYTFLVVQGVLYIFRPESMLSGTIFMMGVFIGFISCQIDSLLGATFERKDLMGKSAVNFTAISISITIFGGILWQIGY